MNTLADLVAAGREREGTAIDVRERTAPYSYREVCTNVWKAANLLGHYGTHPGSDVAVVPGPKQATATDLPDGRGQVDSTDPLLAVLGATLRGATATVAPEQPIEARALVLPAGWRDEYDIAPQCSALAYGGPPDDASAVHFEAELWSENPTEPPEQVDAGTPAIRDSQGTYTHGELVETAGAVVDRYELDEASQVGLTPGVDLRAVSGIVAGVFAPLSAGATVVVADTTAAFDDTTAVVTGGESETDADPTEGEIPVSAVEGLLSEAVEN